MATWDPYFEKIHADPPEEPVLSRSQDRPSDPQEDLLLAIYELTAAVKELKDYLLLEQWQRSYGTKPYEPYELPGS